MKSYGIPAAPLIYAVSKGGHRQAYADLFAELFGGQTIFGPLDRSLRERLSAAASVLFVTLDDDVAGFSATAAKRRLSGRPTAGLLLRPHSCFSGGLAAKVKHNLFARLKRMRGVTIATITPFDIAPAYAEVANIGTADPQYWDLLVDGAVPPPAQTPLSCSVLEAAQGRPVLIAAGSLNPHKGLDLLSAAMQRCSGNTGAFVVYAGKVLHGSEATAQQLRDAGAMVVNRFITDEELSSLYGIADAVWACYAASYDQASGVFGRAIQYGVPAIVREASVIANVAQRHDFSHHAISGDAEQLAALLGFLMKREDQGASRQIAQLARWRDQFVSDISAGLQPITRGVS